jgi:hypothetical protein
VTLLDSKMPVIADADLDSEALIKEARRLRRRRWMRRTLLATLAAGIATAGYFAGSGPPPASHRVARPDTLSTPRLSPSARQVELTRSPDLIQPTTLATLPDGNLLIIDSSRDDILELNANGHLSVFAGDGRLGSEGDGGQARNAELDFTYFSSPAMVVTANGTVDILDNGNCEVRSIDPSGVIRTVLHVPAVNVDPHGTACPVTSIAVSPTGQLYIATDSAVERLLRNGHPSWVAGARGSETHEPTRLTARDVVFSPESLAFDRRGDLDISSVSPKAIYQLSRPGTLTDLGASYATELTSGTDGTVLAGTHGGEVQGVTSDGIRPFYNVTPRRVSGINWGNDTGFQENGIAVTQSGTVYVDNAKGNGYGLATVLVQVRPTGQAALVPIHTPLAATLPKLAAPGFPASLYPPARRSRGRAFSSCPSDTGLQRFTPAAIVRAKTIAQTYLSSQFAYDIAVTDRSWWTADFNDYTRGNDLGSHVVNTTKPALANPIAASLTAACGARLVEDSLAVTVAQSGYSSFAGTLYFLDRAGHALVYDVR